MLDIYQNKDAFLQHVHPLVKLFSLLLVIFSMIAVTEPWTPLFVYILTIIILNVLGKIPLKKLSLISIPFFLFGLTFIWMYALFPAERGATIIIELAGIPIALEDVENGLSLGLRSVVFGTWSLLFVMTTKPTLLLLGLVQQGKCPPKFGYGLMAAYSLLPAFKEELETLRLAHQLRGIDDSKTIRGTYLQMQRYAIPLLASAIRKASRIAVAMESKGFTGSYDRTYYTKISWTWRDAVFICMLFFFWLLLYLIRLHYFL